MNQNSHGNRAAACTFDISETDSLYSLEKQKSRILWNLRKADFLHKYMKLSYVLLLRYLQKDC